MNDNIINLTTDAFEQEVINSDMPVLVDFWADWCGPCKMIAPFIDELANDYAGKAKVCKVNIDEQMALAERFMVMTIPTVLVFKGGEIAEKSVGAKSKADFAAMLDKSL